MSNFNWTALNPEFSEKCQTLIANCKTKGVLMVPFYGIRTLQEQAILYRQGRRLKNINDKVNQLRSKGAPFLADILAKTPPQMSDRSVTNAPPGFSWHNWGFALDCYVAVNGDIQNPGWDIEDRDVYRQYMLYAAEAHELGLTAGANFSSRDKLKADYPHVQMYNKEVSNLFSYPQIDEKFSKKV